jgi:hypothetical protein
LSNILFLGPKIFSVHNFHDASSKWYFDDGKIDYFDCRNKKITHRKGAVLHFQLKTQREFQTKRNRGRAISNQIRYNENFFTKNDKNDEIDKIDNEIIQQIISGTNELKIIINNCCIDQKLKRKNFNKIKTYFMAIGLSDIMNHKLIMLAYQIFKKTRMWLRN